MSPLILLSTTSDGVATITLNSPDKLNAFTTAMIDECCDVMKRCAADDAVRVIVLTGAGRAFCVGAEAGELEAIMNRTAPANRDYLWRHVNRLPVLVEGIEKPVIASVNGPALGGGFDMALMCDLRICSASATFAQTYIELGVIPGDGGAYFLSRLVGTARALELIWTGRTLNASDAAQMGVVNAVVADEELGARTAELASRIAAMPAAAIRFGKRAVQGSLDATLEAHLDTTASHMAVLYETEDFRARASKLARRLRDKS